MLQRLTEPEDEPISIDELKAHLRAPTGSSEDDDLARKISAARRWFEKRTGLALMSQQWTLTVDAFPGWCSSVRYLDLEKRPILSVDSIVSYDDANDETEIDAGEYRVDLPTGHVLLNSGFSWPTDARTGSAGLVTFTAGYGDDPEDVPADIREAIAQMAAYLYIDREGIGPIPAQVTDTANAYELVTA